jgi:hypothetical protein
MMKEWIWLVMYQVRRRFNERFVDDTRPVSGDGDSDILIKSFFYNTIDDDIMKRDVDIPETVVYSERVEVEEAY